ncbi:MAG: ion channel [Chloroflexota bacterium]
MSLFFNFYRWLQEASRTLVRSELARIIWLALLLIVVGTLAYAQIEGWSLLDSLYATIITLTTVGYGDLSPQTPAGRLFAIFFTLIAIGVGGYAITTVAAYAIESRSERVAKQLRKRRMKRIESLENHFILCGADPLGRRIAETFYSAQAPFVIVDPDEEQVKSVLLFCHPGYFQQKLRTFIDVADVDLSQYEEMSAAELAEMLDIPYLLEDPTDDHTLVRAGIGRAAGLVAAMTDDRDNLSIVVGAKALSQRAGNDDFRIMARSSKGEDSRKFHFSGAEQVRVPSVMGGLEMATHMLHPEIGHWWYSLNNTDRNNPVTVHQIDVRDRPQWNGRSVTDLHAQENLMVMAVKRNGRFLSPPPHDLQLALDDVAIVLGAPPAD